MKEMTVGGAMLVLIDGICLANTKHIQTTEAYHYFVKGDKEWRVDRVSRSDGNYYIQSRNKGSDYWHYVDSVSSDWAIED
ncbi:hypothetical protein [Paenibacillus sp. FSL K6-2524]|uniref:hypothetical protein n=1 Tax=Paenibacillus sp. FSL K6-2524 TaxID=2954516 RepID=UPI0030F5F46F